MDPIPSNPNNQNEDKSDVNLPPIPPVPPPPSVPPASFASFVSPAAPPARPISQALPVSENTFKPSMNMNAQHNGQQFKLASAEVQGPKPPLVSGKNSKFILIAIVLVLIIIGGYYFYTKDNNSEPVNSPAAVIPTATPTVDKNLDSDKDGLPDAIEKVLGTYITKTDTDSDGYNDLEEIKSGYSPLIAGAAGKYVQEEWDLVKGKIKIEDRDFYEKEFGMPVASQSPSPSPEASLSPSSEASLPPSPTASPI